MSPWAELEDMVYGAKGPWWQGCASLGTLPKHSLCKKPPCTRIGVEEVDLTCVSAIVLHPLTDKPELARKRQRCGVRERAMTQSSMVGLLFGEAGFECWTDLSR